MKPPIYKSEQDYYEIIGVFDTATQEEIQQAYRKKAKELHPDLNPDRRVWATAQFQLLNEAYKVLGDLEQRKLYNSARWLSRPHRKRRKTVNGQNWWDIPHPTEPDYQRTYQPPPMYTPPRIRPGAWLETYRLGLIRPLYAAVVDLLNSPYRFVLIILGIITILNVIFIMVVANGGS